MQVPIVGTRNEVTKVLTVQLVQPMAQLKWLPTNEKVILHTHAQPLPPTGVGKTRNME